MGLNFDHVGPIFSNLLGVTIIRSHFNRKIKWRFRKTFFASYCFPEEDGRCVVAIPALVWWVSMIWWAERSEKCRTLESNTPTTTTTKTVSSPFFHNHRPSFIPFLSFSVLLSITCCQQQCVRHYFKSNWSQKRPQSTQCTMITLAEFLHKYLVLFLW